MCVYNYRLEVFHVAVSVTERLLVFSTTGMTLLNHRLECIRSLGIPVHGTLDPCLCQSTDFFGGQAQKEAGLTE